MYISGAHDEVCAALYTYNIYFIIALMNGGRATGESESS